MRSITPRSIRKQYQVLEAKKQQVASARRTSQYQLRGIWNAHRKEGRPSADSSPETYADQRQAELFTVISYFEYANESYRLVLYADHGDRSEIIDADGQLRMLTTSNGDVLDPDLKLLGHIRMPDGLWPRLEFEPIFDEAFPKVTEDRYWHPDAYFLIEESIFRHYLNFLEDRQPK